MAHLGRMLLLIAALLVLPVAPAVADHMTGTYAGSGTVAGTTLTLRQNGVQLTGDFSGTHNGTLAGQTDGGDNVQGYIDENDIRYTFYGQWTQQGFTMTLYDTAGNTETLAFTKGGGTGAQPEPAPQPEPEPSPQPAPDPQPASEPQPAPPSANYYTYEDGTQSGPFSLEELQGRIASGSVGRNTLVWQPGQPEWRPARELPELAANLPPEPPRPVRYFVAENGQQVGPLTLEELIGRIEAGETTADEFAWKDGLEAWAPAGTFAELQEAFAPNPGPPPAPPPGAPDLAPEPGPPAVPQPEPVPMLPDPATTTTTTTVPESTTETTTTVAPELATTTTAAPEVTTQVTTTAEAPEAPAVTTTVVPPAVPEPATTITAAPAEPAASTTTTAEAAGNTAALDELIDAILSREFGDATEAQRADVAACYKRELTVLSAAERQIVVESGFNLSNAQADQMEAAHPGITAALEACFTDVAGSGPSSSTVSLPDGRSLKIVGSGGEQSVTSVSGGYDLVIDGVKVSFVNGALTVDGEAREVPDFTSTLTITVANGAVTVSGD